MNSSSRPIMFMNSNNSDTAWVLYDTHNMRFSPRISRAVVDGGWGLLRIADGG